MTQTAGKILVVDDEPVNRLFLEKFLQKKGFTTVTAESGAACIREAITDIDLILLDIMMPVMDGLETCARLKGNEATKEIPVIFLSALDDIASKTRGFEVGGVDYITKPFDGAELLSRVETHLKIRNQQRMLRAYAERLELMVQDRTRQLVHADRLATTGTFAAAIIHEVNNPIMFIQGQTELLKLFWDNVLPSLERCTNEEGKREVATFAERLNSRIVAILEGTERISALVDRLKAYSRSEASGRLERFPLDEAVEDACRLLSYRIKHGVNIRREMAPDLAVCGERQKIGQVFVNLFNNAIDAMPGHRGNITVRAGVAGIDLVISVEDDGPGIAPTDAAQIFDPFFTTKAASGGTGLGLYIVHQIVEDHGGKIRLVPGIGMGATFRIELPAERSCCSTDGSSTQKAAGPDLSMGYQTGCR